jgi:rRNA pseudouridine-1189 N-methylase Emg1 (Nep1/Mra1 family)
MKKYIIKKYILANLITEAMKKERKQRPDDVILDAGSEPQANQTYAIGFDYEPRD